MPINFEELPGNSHKSRDKSEKIKVQKIINGTAKKAKKSDLKKITDVIVSEDARNVKSYILFDILIPSVKKVISEIVTNGIDMILYGETGVTKRNSINNVSRVSYGKFYEERDRGYTRPRVGYNYDDIILSSRGEAEAVLDSMDEILSKYGTVSVADLYDMVGIECNYTDNNYGWTDITTAKVIPVREGFIIKLPRPYPLK